MALGKINTFIDIVTTESVKDRDGFSSIKDTVLVTIRAYKEDIHASEKWANRAVFSEATALFRFRRLPNIEITTDLVIVCQGERYEITSVRDIRNRKMYLETLTKKVVVTDG